MTELSRSFESDLREAILDEAERQLYDAPDNLAFQFLQTVNENFRDYARANDYDIEGIIETGQVVNTDRGSGSVSVTLEWGDLSSIFEFGVDPFVLEGDPMLHFYWEEKDIWVKAESVNWGSETGGIPESRAIRGALNSFRFQAQGGRISF